MHPSALHSAQSSNYTSDHFNSDADDDLDNEVLDADPTQQPEQSQVFPPMVEGSSSDDMLDLTSVPFWLSQAIAYFKSSVIGDDMHGVCQSLIQLERCLGFLPEKCVSPDVLVL